MIKKVNFIYRRYSHHSPHSGYEQLIRFYNGGKSVIDSEQQTKNWLPWPVTRRLVDRVRLRSYIPRSFYAEMEVILRSMNGSGQIHHFLYGEDACWYTLNFKGWRNNKVICSYHHPPYIFEDFVRDKRIVRKLDGIIVTSNYPVPYYQSLIGDPRKVFMVPLGIDTDFYHPADASQKERVCIFCGFYLRDFEMMKNVMRIVGGKDRSIKFNLITREDKHSMFTDCDNVEFESGISEDELLKRYQRAKLMVMPFTDTTSNTAVSEALACGIPVITNDIGGIHDYVDGSCGVIARRSDAEGMAEAVIRLLDDDAAYGHLAMGAREKAVTQMDWRIVARKTTDVYHAVLGMTPAQRRKNLFQ